MQGFSHVSIVFSGLPNSWEDKHHLSAVQNSRHIFHSLSHTLQELKKPLVRSLPGVMVNPIIESRLKTLFQAIDGQKTSNKLDKNVEQWDFDHIDDEVLAILNYSKGKNPQDLLIVCSDNAVRKRLQSMARNLGIRLQDSQGQALNQISIWPHIKIWLKLIQGQTLKPQDLLTAWAGPLFPEAKRIQSMIPKIRTQGRDQIITGFRCWDFWQKIIYESDPELGNILYLLRQDMNSLRELNGTPQAIQQWVHIMKTYMDQEFLVKQQGDFLLKNLELVGLLYQDMSNCPNIEVIMNDLGKLYVQAPIDDQAIRVLGHIEARLIHKPLIILAGLNKGQWLKDKDHLLAVREKDRKALSLPPADHHIGQGIEDFYNLMACDQVIITRSKIYNGEEVSASILWKIIQDLVIEDCKEINNSFIEKSVFPPLSPMNKPSMPAVDIANLYATQVSRLINNPYLHVVEKIWEIRKPDPWITKLTNNILGIYVHCCLEYMIEENITSSQEMDQIWKQKIQDWDPYSKTVAQSLINMTAIVNKIQTIISDFPSQKSEQPVSKIWQDQDINILFRARVDCLVQNSQQLMAIDFKLNSKGATIREAQQLIIYEILSEHKNLQVMMMELCNKQQVTTLGKRNIAIIDKVKSHIKSLMKKKQWEVENTLNMTTDEERIFLREEEWGAAS